jgi:hypothetical protein
MNYSSFKSNYLNPSRIAKASVEFWDKYSKTFFFLFSLIILTLGVYFWYQNIYQSEWSSAQKEEYKRNHNKIIELKEQAFKGIIEKQDQKKDAYDSALKSVKDIFVPYQQDAAKTNSDASTVQTPSSNPSSGSVQSRSILP